MSNSDSFFLLENYSNFLSDDFQIKPCQGGITDRAFHILSTI